MLSEGGIFKPTGTDRIALTLPKYLCHKECSSELARASTLLPIGGERSSRFFRDPDGSLMRGTTRKTQKQWCWDAGDESDTQRWSDAGDEHTQKNTASDTNAPLLCAGRCVSRFNK